MNEQPSQNVIPKLIPASERNLSVLDQKSLLNDSLNDCGAEIQKHGRQLYLEDKAQDFRVGVNWHWMGFEELESLAAGEEIRTPYGEIEHVGRIRLLRGHEGDELVMVVLEFLPDEAVPQGMDFKPWLQLRFSVGNHYLHESGNEEWWVLLYGMWARETQPGSTLAPDNDLLCVAVLRNHENWVEAILECQPRIEVKMGTEKSIRQTALGLAMNNSGVFGVGLSFAGGIACRDLYDNYTIAESSETWEPRAERIAEQLKAAGAIDYSPLFSACHAGNTDEVEAMLKAGFPPNFAIYGQATALCEAVKAGHEDICDLLLCHGADPNQPRYCDTGMECLESIYPLTLAIYHPAIFKRLIQAGADANQGCGDFDDTPAIFKTKFIDEEQAEEIFSYVDFASIRGQHRRSGLFYMDATQLELCRPFIPEELLDEHDGRGTTPLLHAIMFGNLSNVRLLLTMGADPKRPGVIWEDEANCLSLVSEIGHISTQYLTPIQAALQTGNFDLVEYLFGFGVPASRYSLGWQIPKIQCEEEYVTLRDKIQSASDCLDDDIRLEVFRHEPFSAYECANRCEIMLAMLLLKEPAVVITSYPDLIERIDLVVRAEHACLHPAAIEPFRSNQKLNKTGWIRLLDAAIGELKESAESFAATINLQNPNGSNRVATHDLLGPLQNAEQTLISATARISGKILEPMNLAAEVCERASGDFNGGTARAYRDLENSGEVSADDFIDALAEHVASGSTLDHGKLLQAVLAVIPRLEKRCEKLRSKI